MILLNFYFCGQMLSCTVSWYLGNICVLAFHSSRQGGLVARWGWGVGATTNTLDTCRISLFDPLRSQGYFSDIDDDDGGDYYKKTNCQADPGYYSIQKLRSPTILSKRFATCQVNQSISQSFRISNS